MKTSNSRTFKLDFRQRGPGNATTAYITRQQLAESPFKIALKVSLTT